MRFLTTGAILLCLSGCAGFSGPSSLVTPQGASLDKGDDGACPIAVSDTSINRVFHRALCTSAAAPDDVIAARRLLTTGFALAQLRCDDFFWAKSRHQTFARLGRSALPPLVTLTSGVLALLSDKPDTLQNYLKYIALGSAAAGATIDIYEEHFLFGADNIDAVRSLTMDALSEHRTAVLKTDPRTFDSVILHLTDHQALCRPVHILALSRDAIQAGRIAARETRASMLGTSVRDHANVLLALGKLYNQPPVTLDEAGYLWWLYLSTPPAAQPSNDELKIIHHRFSSWGADNPVETSPLWGRSSKVATGAVIAELSKLDADTLVMFSNEVRAIRVRDVAALAAKPADAVKTIAFEPPAWSGYQSISVGVAPNR
ncbi:MULTISPECIES: hypothetical protein [unclassified Sphingobium]|uniref:hypothetical protein n=1 Tax=unclassified Sphingobium TaxID=2611147 RepID=UPI0035A5A5B8